MAVIEPFTDEQLRSLVNLRQRYEVWIDAERKLRALPYDLRRKRVGGRDYLYEIFDRRGNGKSLGAMTVETEQRLEAYRAEKAELKDRRAASSSLLDESSRLVRALRLPLLASEAGAILREADKRRLLGTHLMVVGTNALPTYAVEAGGFLADAPDETEDFDLAWTKAEAEPGEQPLWSLLKAVDETFTVNSERAFQARNRRAYEVEILVAPSRVEGMFRTDKPRPVPLPEQEWLLAGTPVDHVVACRDASPARVLAPDPRWFALHKLWLSAQDKRDPLKRRKDFRQGTAVLNAVELAMPRYPLDAAFERSLPSELEPMYRDWRAAAEAKPSPGWA